ncbi:hypothetical protein AXX17_AT1G52210 [Arabidopsis thaliana]|uniref:Transmembrane protein n=1 Tax=Arabidopsis thaliana TaxID=3702 RepID=A0A178WDS5_ARATH|nr:hypothetical protein AXX17_AT1G52210 [Arabidopsis thaliana]
MQVMWILHKSIGFLLLSLSSHLDIFQRGRDDFRSLLCRPDFFVKAVRFVNRLQPDIHMPLVMWLVGYFPGIIWLL